MDYDAVEPGSAPGTLSNSVALSGRLAEAGALMARASWAGNWISSGEERIDFGTNGAPMRKTGKGAGRPAACCCAAVGRSLTGGGFVRSVGGSCACVHHRMAAKKGDPVVASLAGAMAGVVETLVVWPVENVKTRLQIAKSGTYKGIADCARRTVAEVGPLGLYSGMAPVIIGAIPKAAIR